MKDMKRRLLELGGMWKTLDGYAEHTPGCPIIWGPGGVCDCGLTAVRTRLREAVLALLTRYAVHDAGCPGAVGGKCDCGLEDARRRLAVHARTPTPDVPGDSPPSEGMSP